MESCLSAHGLHGMGLDHDVVRELKVSGVTVREVLVSWASYAHLSLTCSSLELHYRVAPSCVRTSFKVIGTAGRVGKMSLNPPNIPITGEATSASETVRLVTCTFDKNFLERAIDYEIDWEAINPRYFLDFDNREIQHLMRRLAREFLSAQRGYELVVPALAVSAGVDIARYASGMYCKRKDPYQSDRAAIARDIISAADAPITTVSDLSKQMGLSASHLGRLFKQKNHKSLRDFLEEEKFSRAARLLVETDRPLKVVSFMSGYAQTSAFSFAFKRRFGIAPSNYRRAYRNE